MERTKLDDIFENADANWEGDNAFQWLLILYKYSTEVVRWVSHDTLHSVGVDEVIDRLTEEDAKELAELNWMIEDDWFACFV